MTEEPTLPVAKCTGCLVLVPLDTYLGNDHTCDACAERHNALLDGQIPRLKD